MAKGQFVITVDIPENKQNARVTISADSITENNFRFWICACEYFLHKTAQKSNAGYERAMELLCQGAMTYRDL